MKFLLIFPLTVFLYSAAFAQPGRNAHPLTPSSRKEAKPRFFNIAGFKVAGGGYDYGMRSLQAGVVLGHLMDVKGLPAGYSGFYAQAGGGFKNERRLFTSEVGYEHHFLLFATRAGFHHYTDFTHHQFSFMPEIGLTYIGAVSFLYGYNFPISGDQFTIGGNTFTLSVVVPVKKLGKKKRE